MAEETTAFERALRLIDEANSADPNRVEADGREWPKELLYSERMSDMLARFTPDADEAMQLAIRAQHIERWKSPRDAYPMDRMGYLKWRKDLYKIQKGNTAARLAGGGLSGRRRRTDLRHGGQENLKTSADTQLLEDVTDLVFLEHYMLEFVGKHADYSEEKWIDIIQKTWNKMSLRAQDFALSGQVALPESLLPLIKAVGA